MLFSKVNQTGNKISGLIHHKVKGGKQRAKAKAPIIANKTEGMIMPLKI